MEFRKDVDIDLRTHKRFWNAPPRFNARRYTYKITHTTRAFTQCNTNQKSLIQNHIYIIRPGIPYACSYAYFIG